MFNDRTAPRFNARKYRKNIVDESLYKIWKAENNSTLSFKDFKKYAKDIMAEIITNVVEETDGVKLPIGIGDIYLGYVPNVSRRPIDYKLSLEHGKKIYLENWNSNRKMGKIIYGTSNRKYVYKMHKLWHFYPTRNFKHIARDAFTNHPTRYKNTIENRRAI